MKNKLKPNFKDKKTIIISILIGLILIGLIIFICTKIFHKDKELTPDNPTTNEFENYLKDAIKPFDEDSIKDFISSTDSTGTVDEIYWGATYSDDINTNVKILYTLSRMFFNDSDLIKYMAGANMFDKDTELGTVKLSIKFINKALAAKFKDLKMEPETIITDGFFRGVNAVICDDTECMIPISMVDYTDEEDSDDENADGTYESEKGSLEKTSSGYEIFAKYYFNVMQFDGDMKYGVYDSAFKEKVYCETTLPEIYISNGRVLEDCKNTEGMPSIKYTFDKNYRFIKSENV